jgi:hypothetical protein
MQGTRLQTPNSYRTRQQRSSNLHLATITQNIEDANIANTDDANSLMLHSAKKYVVKTPNSHRTSNKRFSSLLIDTTPNKTENANTANGDKSPFELTRPPVKERTHLTRLPSMATLCREHIANSSLIVNKRSSSLRLDAFPRPRVKERTHINKTTNYLQVFTSILYFPGA